MLLKHGDKVWRAIRLWWKDLQTPCLWSWHHSKICQLSHSKQCTSGSCLQNLMPGLSVNSPVPTPLQFSLDFQRPANAHSSKNRKQWSKEGTGTVQQQLPIWCSSSLYTTASGQKKALPSLTCLFSKSSSSLYTTARGQKKPPLHSPVWCSPPVHLVCTQQQVARRNHPFTHLFDVLHQFIQSVHNSKWPEESTPFTHLFDVLHQFIQSVHNSKWPEESTPFTHLFDVLHQFIQSVHNSKWPEETTPSLTCLMFSTSSSSLYTTASGQKKARPSLTCLMFSTSSSSLYTTASGQKKARPSLTCLMFSTSSSSLYTTASGQKKPPLHSPVWCSPPVHPVCTQQQVARRKHALHSPVWCSPPVHPVCTQQQVARRKHALHSPVWCSPPVHPVCTPRPQPSSSSHPARASEDPKSAQLTAMQDQPAALATDPTEGSAHSSKPYLSVCIPSSWPPCGIVLTGGSLTGVIPAFK